MSTARKDTKKVRFLVAELEITERGQVKEFTLNVPDNTKAIQGVSVVSVRTGDTAVNIRTTKHYYGVAAEPANVNQAFADTLSNQEMLSKHKVVDLDADTGEYIWYFRPKRLGPAYFELDGETGGMSLHETTPVLSLTDPDTGYAEDHYVYRSDKESLGQKQLYAR